MSDLGLGRPLYPKTPAFIFFFGTHGIFMKFTDVLGHKESFNKFQRISITIVYFLVTMYIIRN